MKRKRWLLSLSYVETHAFYEHNDRLLLLSVLFFCVYAQAACSGATRSRFVPSLMTMQILAFLNLQ